MAQTFLGTYEELQGRLACLDGKGEWIGDRDNEKLFQHVDGTVLKWNPETGVLSFKGKGQAKLKLIQLVTDVLSAGDVAASNTGGAQPEASPVDAASYGGEFANGELVLGFVGAVGTEVEKAIDIVEKRLRTFGYTPQQIRVSSEVVQVVAPVAGVGSMGEYDRISALMTAGNEARSRRDSILAEGIAAIIGSRRKVETATGRTTPSPRHAYLINSLKHPSEVSRLRQIYPQGFFLIGVHASESRRFVNLTEDKGIEPSDARSLMERDEDEHIPYGQRTRDTFHMSDFFVDLDKNQDKLKNSLWRILDILFGAPFVTPTFDEYAMFMAFAAALRSADLSRQVGAVVAKNNEIISTGANDCPCAGGGQYWPTYHEDDSKISDVRDGRDHMRGEDRNEIEQQRLINDIVASAKGVVTDEAEFRSLLEKSPIVDLTEFGRVVHAEMEALLSCARNSGGARGADIYCTTFPCHNCAKHIVAAGIRRVVYVEPYAKSKAAEFHDDSISIGLNGNSNLVTFEPFIGVGPRRFFDLFSMKLGSGAPLRRKDEKGTAVAWVQSKDSKLRLQMLPKSYLDLESLAARDFNRARKATEASKCQRD